MELGYTYFESESGFFAGWFDDFPEDVTQGKTLEELEEMLADMYECLNLAKYHKKSFPNPEFPPVFRRKPATDGGVTGALRRLTLPVIGSSI